MSPIAPNTPNLQRVALKGFKQRREKRAILERIAAQEAQMQKLLGGPGEENAHRHNKPSPLPKNAGPHWKPH